ncbi:Cytochrome P450 93A3, partial [Mucuna pruriens]
MGIVLVGIFQIYKIRRRPYINNALLKVRRILEEKESMEGGGGSVLSYMLFCFLGLVILTIVLKSISIGSRNSSSKVGGPPSPPTLPIIGHLHLLGSVIPKSFQELARLYGPLIQLRLGASTCVVVSNAQVAKQVMKTHDLNFCYRPQFGSSEYFLYKGSAFITAPYGPYWRFMKKLCVTQLLSSSQLGRFVHIREDEIEKLLKSLMASSTQGQASDLTFHLTALTNNVMCRMAMSTTCFDKVNDAQEIHGLVREFLHVGAKLSMGEVLGPFGKLDLFGYGKKLVKIVDKFDQVLERILEEHQERNSDSCPGQTGDMMDILLQVYKDPNAEVRLTRNDIKAFFLFLRGCCKDIFLAGTDTSSTALEWAMAEIMNNPGVLKKVRAEIDAVVGTSRLVNESDVPNLRYLQAVVKEVLRLHPTAPFALRQSAEDCSINGYHIKGQTRTLINVYAIMRDPEEWVNPEEFIPERFLEGSDVVNGIRMDGGDFRYLPFGFGRRGCPGSSLALTVIHVTIASLIQCFQWKIKGGDRVSMEEGSSFSAGLAKPLLSTNMADYQGYILLFITWLVSIIVVRAILSRKKKNSNRPPSPLALPIIGHLHLLAPIPHQALHKLSTRYGPIMHLFLGSIPCVVASTPEAATEFLKTHETHFSNRPKSSAVDYLTYGSQDFSFAPYGPYWKFMKKICMSELLGGHTLSQLLPVRRQETLRLLRLLLEKGKACEAVDVGGELLRLSNNVVSRMLMSQTCSENDSEAEEVRKLVQETVLLTGKFNVSDFIWLFRNWDLQGFGNRLKEIRDRFDTMMERVIKEHEEERRERKELGSGGEDHIKDLLDILLDIHEDENSDIKLTIENIKAFIFDIFMAGTDTSALTTEWAMAELINHPHVMERARQEIDAVIGNSRIVKESDIVNLSYLQAVVKETLRIHPTGPLIVRESSESCTIWGYEIPAKTQLFVNVWAIGRDPNHWENPLEFRPERFISEEGSGKSQLDVRGQHFHLIPFGSGRRGCPGTSLALQVVQANLAAMIQCFEWKLKGGNGTVEMEEKPGITLSRARPLICVPVPRLNPFPPIFFQKETFDMAYQVLLICLVLTILLASILWRKQKKTFLPPSPISLPIIGHLHLLSPTPHQDFYKLSIRYGPIIHLFLGSVPCVVASTAEAAKEFLKNHESSFSNRPAQTVAVEALTYGFRDFLFAPYGPYWKFMKKLCMSELLGGHMLDQFLPVRRQEATRFVKRVLRKGIAGEAVDFGREFMTLSNHVVSRMTVSRTSSESENEDEEMRKLVADTAELIGKFNISDFVWFLKSFDLQGFNKRLQKIRESFDAVMERIIKQREEERRKDKETGGTHQFKDMLDVLLDIFEDDSYEMKLDKDNIKAFILDILVAGTDTSAVTMEWAMAELINNPRVLEKARQEMDAVIGKSRIVEESDIVNLPYLQAIVRETLRLHPAGPLIFRESSRSDVVCGYDIPAKTRLFINVWAIGRDPNHWENPLEFRPERFIGEEGNGQSQMDVRGQHYQLIPFGSGRRGCPGTSLALQIVHVNLAAIIQCFQWKVDGGNGTVDMEERSGITLPRAHPIICVPVPRLNPFPAV